MAWLGYITVNAWCVNFLSSKCKVFHVSLLLDNGFHVPDVALERQVDGDLVLGDMGQVGT